MKHNTKLHKHSVSDKIQMDKMDKGTKRKLGWNEEKGGKAKKNKLKVGEKKNDEKEEETTKEIEEERNE